MKDGRLVGNEEWQREGESMEDEGEKNQEFLQVQYCNYCIITALQFKGLFFLFHLFIFHKIITTICKDVEKK